MESFKFVKVVQINGMTAEERAWAISSELFSISRPNTVRDEKDVTKFLFSVFEKDGNFFLKVDMNYEIIVHPDKNISTLIDLFPSLDVTEKQNLSTFIENSSSFLFYQILPSTSEVLDDI